MGVITISAQITFESFANAKRSGKRYFSVETSHLQALHTTSEIEVILPAAKHISFWLALENAEIETVPVYQYHQGQWDVEEITYKHIRGAQTNVLQIEDDIHFYYESDEFIYRLSPVAEKEKRVIYEQQIESKSTEIFHCSQEAESPVVQDRKRAKTREVCYTADLAVVIDSAFNEIHGAESESLAFLITHTMMGFYGDQTDVRLKIGAIINFGNQDPYHITTTEKGGISSSNLLSHFRTWSWDFDFDFEILLSGYNFQSPYVGKAYVGGTCSGYRNVAVCEANRSDVKLNASIMAHELGHIFGMQHDKGEEVGGCPKKGYIMNSIFNARNPSIDFSNCSKKKLATYLATQDDTSSCFDIGGCINRDEQVLPITLTSFDVDWLASSNLLRWETASEISASHFEIETARDAIAFTSVHETAARGESSTYAYELPLSDQKYVRLKMIDIDGSHTYSEVKTLQTGSAQNSLALVYPNPSGLGERSYLRLSSEQTALNIVIYNVLGQVQWTHVVGSETDIALPILAQGQYYITIGEEVLNWSVL